MAAGSSTGAVVSGVIALASMAYDAVRGVPQSACTLSEPPHLGTGRISYPALALLGATLVGVT